MNVPFPDNLRFPLQLYLLNHPLDIQIRWKQWSRGNHHRILVTDIHQRLSPRKKQVIPADLYQSLETWFKQQVDFNTPGAVLFYSVLAYGGSLRITPELRGYLTVCSRRPDANTLCESFKWRKLLQPPVEVPPIFQRPPVSDELEDLLRKHFTDRQQSIVILWRAYPTWGVVSILYRQGRGRSKVDEPLQGKLFEWMQEWLYLNRPQLKVTVVPKKDKALKYKNFKCRGRTTFAPLGYCSTRVFLRHTVLSETIKELPPYTP